jgi:hypothetical protein
MFNAFLGEKLVKLSKRKLIKLFLATFLLGFLGGGAFFVPFKK